MAPEYALGRACSARSDLFSLGVLLYECLAGRRPFDGDNDMQTLRRAREGRHEPVYAVAPDTPKPLAQAIESLLQPDPSERPPHAEAFLLQLAGAEPPPLAHRDLGVLVRRAARSASLPPGPGLASTRPVPTRVASTLRPPKRLRSRG